jgi:cellulose synthase/poly-beta-1,6-N-acetylglucosamine synthase-like glycosyltransferase
MMIADLFQTLAVAAYAAAQAGLALYATHRYSMLVPARRERSAGVAGGSATPHVTVQLPVFNERFVVERLVDAVAALDWPAGRLEIQVLDDSTDDTTAIARAAVARHRARGVDIRLLHREHREGFKAGALAAGLAVAHGELIAVFDADFVPAPDFLRRLVPHFADPRVGLAQARWGHLNRDESALTSAQAVMLDAHFLLEHATRMGRGLFFNFNGTAGVWRRTCVESAGGWSHDTLTEDLDLSYRAQLAGWRFVFDPGVVVPAELPGRMEALKSQQRRWARGAIQTARKLLPAVWRAPLPLAVKVEAFFHLTSNVAYPLLLALGALLLPVMLGRSTLDPVLVWTLHGLVVVLGLVPVSLFLASGLRAAGRAWWRIPGDVLGALVLGVGLSVNNTRAVLQALGDEVGDWERTPKTGAARRGSAYAASRRPAGVTELALAAYFVALSAWTVVAGQLRALPFMVLLMAGFAWVGRASIAETATARRG